MRKIFVIAFIIIVSLLLVGCISKKKVDIKPTNFQEPVVIEVNETVNESVNITTNDSVNITENVTVNTTEPEPEVILPDATAFSVKTIYNISYSSAQSQEDNKSIVVYFTATWSPDGPNNWAAINSIYPKYKDKVNFIAVSIEAKDNATAIEKWLEDEGITFDMAAGNTGLASNFNVEEPEAKFAINREGKLVERHDGVLSLAKWDKLFESVYD